MTADSKLMTSELNLFLTCAVSGGAGIHISQTPQGTVCVWLPGRARFDPPSGTGDSVFEALADAVYMATRKVKA